MKKGNSTLVIVLVLVAVAIIAYYVYTKSQQSNGGASATIVNERIAKLQERIPQNVRERIVALYNWQEGKRKLEMRDGIVFDLEKNQPDEWGRTSIVQYLFDAAIYHAREYDKVIDIDTENWIKFVQKYTINEFRQSI